MFRTIASACLALAFATLLAATPASAQQPVGGAGAVDREKCVDELIICVAECTWMDDAGYAKCNQDCNEDYGICVRGDVANVGGTTGVSGGQSQGTFEPPDRRNPHVVAVGLIDAAELERACTRVDGLFGRTKEMYGCINRMCDGAGNCTLVCYGGNCLAITPGQLPDRLTLIGVLQNGSNVVKGGRNVGPTPSLVESEEDGPGPYKEPFPKFD